MFSKNSKIVAPNSVFKSGGGREKSSSRLLISFSFKHFFSAFAVLLIFFTFACAASTTYDFNISEGNILIEKGDAGFDLKVTSASGNTDNLFFDDKIMITGESNSYIVLIDGSDLNQALVNVTIHDLVITSTTDAAFALTNKANVSLTLSGTNCLESGAYYVAHAGLEVPKGCSIEIQSIDPNDDASGYLKAVGRFGWGGNIPFRSGAGAGIGGFGKNATHAKSYLGNPEDYVGGDSGVISIKSGTIEAYGGRGSSWTETGGAAGIGGGGGSGDQVDSRSPIAEDGGNATIFISGGNIIAKGAVGGGGDPGSGIGAGIGGGGAGTSWGQVGGYGGNAVIIISGGIIDAEGGGISSFNIIDGTHGTGGGGAGIGGGGASGKEAVGGTGDVTITDGIIKVTGGGKKDEARGAGIGGGGVNSAQTGDGTVQIAEHSGTGGEGIVTISGDKTDIIVISGGIGGGYEINGRDYSFGSHNGEGTTIIKSGNVLILGNDKGNSEFKNGTGVEASDIDCVSFTVVDEEEDKLSEVKVQKGNYVAYTRKNDDSDLDGTVSIWLPVSSSQNVKFSLSGYLTQTNAYAIPSTGHEVIMIVGDDPVSGSKTGHAKISETEKNSPEEIENVQSVSIDADIDNRANEIQSEQKNIQSEQKKSPPLIWLVLLFVTICGTVGYYLRNQRRRN